MSPCNCGAPGVPPSSLDSKGEDRGVSWQHKRRQISEKFATHTRSLSLEFEDVALGTSWIPRTPFLKNLFASSYWRASTPKYG